ncbi:hypothetical protein ACP275_13G052800 [Erythranthe tilingii]
MIKHSRSFCTDFNKEERLAICFTHASCKVRLFTSFNLSKPMGFKVSHIGTAGSMAVLVLVLESMAANAGFEINSLTSCVLTSFRKVYWKTTSVLLFGLLFQSAGSDDESIQKANIEGRSVKRR